MSGAVVPTAEDTLCSALIRDAIGGQHNPEGDILQLWDHLMSPTWLKGLISADRRPSCFGVAPFHLRLNVSGRV